MCVAAAGAAGCASRGGGEEVRRRFEAAFMMDDGRRADMSVCDVEALDDRSVAAATRCGVGGGP